MHPWCTWTFDDGEHYGVDVIGKDFLSYLSNYIELQKKMIKVSRFGLTKLCRELLTASLARSGANNLCSGETSHPASGNAQYANHSYTT